MNILIRSDGVVLTKSLRADVYEKIGRVEQYVPRALRARVLLGRVSVHRSPNQYVARVLFEIPGNDLSAEATGPGPLAALDIVAETIERRLRKRKTAQLARRNGGNRARRFGKETDNAHQTE